MGGEGGACISLNLFSSESLICITNSKELMFVIVGRSPSRWSVLLFELYILSDLYFSVIYTSQWSILLNGLSFSVIFTSQWSTLLSDLYSNVIYPHWSILLDDLSHYLKSSRRSVLLYSHSWHSVCGIFVCILHHITYAFTHVQQPADHVH